MQLRSIDFQKSGSRLLSAAIVAATLALPPGLALAADPDAHVERSEHRIGEIHSKLKITADQEELWGKVAATMHENARAMDALTQERKDHASAMTAVDDLQSYGRIADAHADGIRKLTPVFATLYASMSAPQKAEADTLFRHGDRAGEHRHHHHKHGKTGIDVK